MVRILDKGIKVYDAKNYNYAYVVFSNEDKTIVRDDNYNQYEIDTDDLYVINVELSNKYGIDICDEHNETMDNYPYYIPIADENAFEIELEHYSFEYA